MGAVVQQAGLRVKTELDDLNRVLDWFAQFDQDPLPHAVWLQCQLALAEAFTNAVRHAHRNRDPETPIDIQVTADPHRLEIQVWDCGDPFELMDSITLAREAPPTEQEGGRGLLLMQRIASELSYHRDPDGRNCLRLVKTF
jgi:serine/threonine-protein kinase RsbW